MAESVQAVAPVRPRAFTANTMQMCCSQKHVSVRQLITGISAPNSTCAEKKELERRAKQMNSHLCLQLKELELRGKQVNLHELES